MASIADWYQQYLGRAPDQEGLNYWQGVQNSGQYDQSSLLNEFLHGAQTNSTAQGVQDSQKVNQGVSSGSLSSIYKPLAPVQTTTQVPRVTQPSTTPVPNSNGVMTYENGSTKYVGKDANGNPLTGWGLAADMQKYAGQGYSPYTDPYLNNNTALTPWLPEVQAQRDQQNHLGGLFSGGLLGDGFLGNLFDFNIQTGKDVLGGVIKDPSRLITGVDPLSTGAWNSVLGTDKQALVNPVGGPVANDFSKAESNGIHTSGGVSTAINVANIAAGAAGVAGLGNAIGGLTSGLGTGGSTAGGVGTGATTGGLGTAGTSAAGAAVDASIPAIHVVGAAGGAGGAGLGTAAAGAAGAGLGAIVNNGSTPTNGGNTDVDPNIPKVVVNGNTGAGSTSLANMLGNTTAAAGGLLAANEVTKPSTDTSGFGAPIPVNGYIPDSDLFNPVFTPPNTTTNVDLPADTRTPIVVPPGSGGSSGISLPSLPSLNDIVKGIGTVAGGVADYKMNQADKDYYQQLMDKMMGMYMPGTPEAGLMESKMRAQDAAAGRNSQYGIRAQNLAAMLADQRAKIMTSPTFGKMAEASRGHYDSSLTGLSSLLGSAGTSGTALNGLLNYAGSSIANSSIGSSISDWFKSATAPER